MAHRLLATGLAVAFLVSVGAIASGGDVPSIGTCGPAPPAQPQYKKAAEGFAPLPLPAVPLRRTETKRPPQAPLLVGKLKWGQGQDWLNDPGDLEGLMRTVRETTGMWYGHRVEELDQMVRRSQMGVQNKIPMIFMNGHAAFELTEQERQALKQYVLGGGTLLMEACCGMKAFAEAAKAEIAKMFPDRELALLPEDHPLYNSYYKIREVSYEAGGKSPLDKGRQYKDRPLLRAVHVGPRAALIWSEYDLSCGWDRHTHPYGRRVACNDALQLGVNLVTYACANSRLGKFLAKTRTLEGPDVRHRQQFVFAQVRHHGDWNPMPSALANLLKELASNTSASVRFERKEVELTDPDLYQYPFLYITGMRDPGFSAAEVKHLKQYLLGGGFVLADATYGLGEFDTAMRRLVQTMFPEAKLERLTSDHPIFHAFEDLDTLMYTMDGGERPSELEALTVDGQPVLVYSRYDLGCGWARERCPYRKGVVPDDALRLGVNIIVFAMQN